MTRASLFALLLFSAAAQAVTDDVFVWLKWDGVIRYLDGSAVPSQTQLGLGYRIYQSSDGEAWSQVAEVTPNGVTIVPHEWRGDLTIDFDVDNLVRVTAFIGEEETEPSNEVIIPLPELQSPSNPSIPITIYFQEAN